MTHAFKCDNCQSYFDGHSPRERDLRVGNFVMRVAFAKLVDKPENASPSIELLDSLHLKQMPEGLAGLLGVSVNKVEELDGKELHSADFCPDCTAKVLANALIATQAEGALMAAQLDIQQPDPE